MTTRGGSRDHDDPATIASPCVLPPPPLYRPHLHLRAEILGARDLGGFEISFLSILGNVRPGPSGVDLLVACLIRMLLCLDLEMLLRHKQGPLLCSSRSCQFQPKAISRQGSPSPSLGLSSPPRSTLFPTKAIRQNLSTSKWEHKGKPQQYKSCRAMVRRRWCSCCSAQ